MQAFYCTHYEQAHQKFCEAVSELGWSLELRSLSMPAAEQQLVTAVAQHTPVSKDHSAGDRALVITTGLHGVEGFFGTAVLLKLLEQYRQLGPPACTVLLMHALNPYGYAHCRRCDEQNRDLNRNFLLPGQKYEGAPELYHKLDSFLNPRHCTQPGEPFYAKALMIAMRYGVAAVQSAIASGQYEYPKGLFYGGDQASDLSAWLAERLPHWLQGTEQVMHLDFHTGLGSWMSYKLMFETRLNWSQGRRVHEFFRDDELVELLPMQAPNDNRQGLAKDASAHPPYRVQGSFGRWCAQVAGVPEYLFAVAEFGTYPAVKILRALRRENQLHHWGQSQVSATALETKKASMQPEKKELLEAFCPRSEKWRRVCLDRAVGVVERATRMLLKEGAA